MLNLKHLYYFYVFAQELSTTSAAERLKISSPALSTQLKQLDEYLCFPLTRRMNGKFILTSHGETVFSYAEKMFSTYEDLMRKMTLARSIRSDQFIIGIGKNVGPRFSLDFLELYHKSELTQAKNLCISYDSSERLIADFEEGHYDLIVGSFESLSSQKSGWISHQFSFPVRLFAHRSLFMNTSKVPVAETTTLGFEEVIALANAKNIGLVAPMKNSVLRTEMDEFLSKQKTEALRKIECNSATGILQLIERGLAIGLVPVPCLFDVKFARDLIVAGPSNGYWSHNISVLTRESEKISPRKHLNLDEALSLT